MKRLIRAFAITLAFIPFLFFIGEEMKVEAAPCMMGSYAQWDEAKQDYVCEDLNDVVSSNNDSNETIGEFSNYVGLFAKVLSGISLGIAITMIVYAGFLYTTSRGDSKQTEKAKLHIIAAGIGLLICVLSFTIAGIFHEVIGTPNKVIPTGEEAKVEEKIDPKDLLATNLPDWPN